MSFDIYQNLIKDEVELVNSNKSNEIKPEWDRVKPNVSVSFDLLIKIFSGFNWEHTFYVATVWATMLQKLSLYTGGKNKAIGFRNKIEFLKWNKYGWVEVDFRAKNNRYFGYDEHIVIAWRLENIWPADF